MTAAACQASRRVGPGSAPGLAGAWCGQFCISAKLTAPKNYLEPIVRKKPLKTPHVLIRSKIENTVHVHGLAQVNIQAPLAGVPSHEDSTSKRQIWHSYNQNCVISNMEFNRRHRDTAL
jgi:hypothetical protein